MLRGHDPAHHFLLRKSPPGAGTHQIASFLSVSDRVQALLAAMSRPATHGARGRHKPEETKMSMISLRRL